MAGLRGVILRLGVACSPLIAVVLLCVGMFSGLGKHRSASGLSAQASLIPAAEAAPVEKQPKLQKLTAAFERLHIAHATIRVPN